MTGPIIPNSRVNKRYKQRYPLESFDPRYNELLRRGALESFSLIFPSRKEAKEFQRRAYIYRIRAKEAGLAGHELLFRCKLSHTDNVLTIAPYDGEFESVWNQAGLGSPDAPAPFTEGSGLPTPDSSPTVDPTTTIPKEYLP
jgi:hypothetical protein